MGALNDKHQQKLPPSPHLLEKNQHYNHKD